MKYCLECTVRLDKLIEYRDDHLDCDICGETLSVGPLSNQQILDEKRKQVADQAIGEVLKDGLLKCGKCGVKFSRDDMVDGKCPNCKGKEILDD